MAKQVNVTVKTRGGEIDQVREFLTQRLKSRFGRVNHSSTDAQTDRFSGGSLMRPYGFKATASYENIGADNMMVTLNGRPAMGLLSYISLIVFLVLVGFALAYPLEGAMGLIFAFVIVVASRRSQKSVSADLEKTAGDLVTRFSA